MWCFGVKTFYEVFLFIFTVAVDFAMYLKPSARIKEHELLYPDDKIIHVACLAHVRRKFFDASLNGKSPGAGKAVKYIQLIYKKEEELLKMKLSPDELVSKRKELIKPIFNEFHEWLLEIQPKVPPTLKFGRAITYAFLHGSIY